MKNVIGLAALSLFVGDVWAHYIFDQLSIGSTTYPVYQYIRKNTNYNSPVTDLTSDDLRCNVGGESGATTQTVAVKAGDQFTFTLNTPVYHDGPVSIYMSKAPGNVSDYDGSGPWFKIKDWGPIFTNGQATWDLKGSYTYNIPTCIPDGQYLLRIQSLAIHNPWPAGIPQFYIECAQISVSGGGDATPSPTCLIPGAFKDTDPGYTVNIYTNFHNYTVPGPAVWSCGGSGGGGTGDDSSPSPSSEPTTLVTSRIPASPTGDSSGGGEGCSVAQYGQCGGTGYTGCTTCASGSTCSQSNEYYSQCL